MPQRIDDAMIEVIAKLNSITEHLRKYNFEDSSNRISKNTQEVVSIFTDAVVKFSDDQMIMEEPASRPTSQDSAEYSSAGTNDEDGDDALRGLERGYKKVVDEGQQTSSQDAAVLGNVPIRQAKSWAKVAAARPGNGGIPTQPRRMVGHFEARQAALNQPAVPTSNIQPIETEEEKAGLMIVAGDFGPCSLNHITSKIREGPLFRVEISHSEKIAEIVFQRAAHALEFVERDAELVDKLGYGRFGPGYTILCTEVLDWTDAIRQMENQPKERRRLTFARAGLLGKPITFKKFKTDVFSAAGTDGVDLIWAFNSGNATAVFKSVDVAREVLKRFLAKANQPGPYKGVQVTYSTDPCEKQLALGTPAPAGYSQSMHKNGFSKKK